MSRTTRWPEVRMRKTILTVALAALAVSFSIAQQAERVSRLGAYSGYSQRVYDGWTRTSQYVAVRDGTKLAVDLLRPTKDGKAETKPLPVIWTHHRYHRAAEVDGTVRSIAANMPWLETVIRHGYVVAAADARGSGASFGIQEGIFSPQETRDAYDITEWLAAQPWSSGNIGMFGRSYLGITQYFAASQKPPHLKAIFPEMALFDRYSFVYAGGIYRNNFISNWGHLTKNLDASLSFNWYSRPPRGGVGRVDEDKDGSLRTAAIREHRANRDVVEMMAPLRFRDSLDELTGKMLHAERSPFTYRDNIGKSGAAVYHLNGWFDMFPRDAVLWYRNLPNPQKLVIGPWFHGESAGLDLAVEHLRWFDYWLKGIDNGIMKEEPVHYWTMGAAPLSPPSKGGEKVGWRSSRQWPPANAQRTKFFFHAGPSGSIASVNDGLLASDAPPSADGQDAYTVDYTTTSGNANRWTNGYGGDRGYPDMAPNDRKGLTYTTAPAPADIEVTGHPVVNLWVTSTAKDGDFFVHLEEVGKDGHSHYVTEGALRASHRAVSEPPYDYVGLPYHRSFAADVAELPSEPVELAFDLHPTSKIFAAGNRIRITITCADKDNQLTPRLSPLPKVTVHRNTRYASHVTLPVSR